MTLDALEDQFLRADSLPYGRARVAAFEELVQRADADVPDTTLPFRARYALIYGYMRAGERVRSFVPFAWCLTQFDRDRERFGEFAHGILWAFKWQVDGLTLFPEVPLERTLAVLDDMERRYREGGHGLNAVHGARHTVAWHLGDHAGAAEHYRLWDASPIDDLSDCRGCLPSSKAHYLSATGRDEDAIRLAQPVLEGHLTCSEQPFGILTGLLSAYARTGRHDEAVAAHRKAYRAIRSDRSQIGRVADHLQFLARTGNALRGLELVEAHIGWLDSADSPHAEMRLSAAIARTLADIDPDLPVRRGGSRVAAGEIATETARRARGIALRFDARNGSDAVSRRIEEELSPEVWAEALPLTTLARRARTVAPAAPAPQVGPVLPSPGASLAELVDHFEARWLERDEPGAYAAFSALDEHSSDEPSWPDDLRGRYLTARGLVLANRDDDLAGAVAAWQAALPLLAGAGLDVEVLRVRARIGTVLAGSGDPAEGYAVAEEPLRWLAEHDTPAQRRAGWAMRLAMFILDEDPAQAAQLAATARAAGLPPDEAAGAALVHGHALASIERLDEAEAAYDAAVESAASGAPELRISAHGTRGQFLLHRDQPERAREDFAEAVALLTSLGVQAPHALLDLGWAELGSGNPGAAAEAGEEALRVAADSDEPGDWAAPAHRLLLDAYRRLGEQGPALEEVHALRELMAPPADSDQAAYDHAELNETEGLLLMQLERDVEAVVYFDAAADTYLALGVTERAVGVLRRAGSSAVWSGQDDAAEERRTRARGLLADLDPASAGFHRGGLLFDRAEQSMRDENGAEAAGYLRQSAAAYDDAGETRNADDCLLRAAEVAPETVSVRELQRIHKRQQTGTQPWFRSGWLLVDALTADGDQRAARKLGGKLEKQAAAQDG